MKFRLSLLNFVLMAFNLCQAQPFSGPWRMPHENRPRPAEPKKVEEARESECPPHHRIKIEEVDGQKIPYCVEEKPACPVGTSYHHGFCTANYAANCPAGTRPGYAWNILVCKGCPLGTKPMISLTEEIIACEK
jgi:hypothetical protein